MSDDTHAVIVKFYDNFDLSYADNVEAEFPPDLGILWTSLLQVFPGISLNRVFTLVSPDGIKKKADQAAQKDPTCKLPELLKFFVIYCPPNMDAESLAQTLCKWPVAIEYAYVAPKLSLPAVQPNDDTYYSDQGYLKPAPEGVDAVYAWTKPGGAGENQSGADIEQGWMLDHEDIIHQPCTLLAGTTMIGALDHGTAVLGVICAEDNNMGVVGIVPKISRFMVIPAGIEAYPRILLADAIASCIILDPYSVILIEQQIIPSFEPVECDILIFYVIKMMTTLGYIVIEPAGNGAIFLDNTNIFDFSDLKLKHRLNRNSPDFRDSGAIMVGACTEMLPHKRWNFSNYGSRIDCWAWGENVTTCREYQATPGNSEFDRYKHRSNGTGFSATSAASAIIAGVAISIQGIAEKSHNLRLEPQTMRAYLSSVNLSHDELGKMLFGTPVIGALGDIIGVMPDLKKIADSIIAGTKITLKTPTVSFIEIYQGMISWNAASFEVTGFQQEINLELSTAPTLPFHVVEVPGLGTPVKVSSSLGKTVKADMWFSFIAPIGTFDPPTPQTIVIRCKETGEEFNVQLSATITLVPFLTSVLALDKSGSMNNPAGNAGFTKIEALKDAVSNFIALEMAEIYDPDQNITYPGNYLGIISFSKEAQAEKDITYFDAQETGRTEMTTFVQQFTAPTSYKANTAIGKGILKAKEMLDSFIPTYTNYPYKKSIIIFTDGRENISPYITDIMGSVDYLTYAIGLGTESQVSTVALTSLTESVGGYCLLTGELTPETEDYFRLTKYFIEILMDLTSMEVTTDPSGIILPGQLIRIPFTLNEADLASNIVLLVDKNIVGFEIETPTGETIKSNAPGVSFGMGPKIRFCRMALPVTLSQGTSHSGTWHACLRIDSEMSSLNKDLINDGSEKRREKSSQGVRYNLSVYTRSNLRADLRLDQRSFLPGEMLNLRAVLKEYDVPIVSRATVKAEISRPDHTIQSVTMKEVEPGIFENEIPMKLSGVYHVGFFISGITFYGSQFTREKHFTAAAWRGSNKEQPTSSDNTWLPTQFDYWLLLTVLLIISLLLLLLVIHFLF